MFVDIMVKFVLRLKDIFKDDAEPDSDSDSDDELDPQEAKINK